MVSAELRIGVGSDRHIWYDLCDPLSVARFSHQQHRLDANFPTLASRRHPSQPLALQTFQNDQHPHIVISLLLYGEMTNVPITRRIIPPAIWSPERIPTYQHRASMMLSSGNVARSTILAAYPAMHAAEGEPLTPEGKSLAERRTATIFSTPLFGNRAVLCGI